MTVRKDGTRIRGAKMTEEERAANKHVSFRLNNSVTENVRNMAQHRGVTQGAMMQSLIVDGIRMEELYDLVRYHIMTSDSEYAQYDIQAPTAFEPMKHNVPAELVPDDRECFRMIRRFVTEGIKNQELEYGIETL